MSAARPGRPFSFRIRALAELLLAVGGLLSAPASMAQAGGAAQGRLDYESRQISSDGVEKQQRFSERWVRSEGHVWTERILPKARLQPAGAAHSHEGSGAQHLHPADLATASKHVWTDAKGQVQLNLIRSDLRTIVKAEVRDFGQLGFDGRFAPAWSLFDPAQLRQLKVRAAAPGEPADPVWYEKREGGQFLKVQWSERLKLALSVEAGADDGSYWTRTRLSLDPQSSGPLPWTRLAGYRQIDYVDLLD